MQKTIPPWVEVKRLIIVCSVCIVEVTQNLNTSVAFFWKKLLH
jgi:hypothetical protein